jgi:predicted TIM-barrel fold metal-dependent hydrolase
MAGMTEKERYLTLDLPFFRREISPWLPSKVLDFHAHVWRTEDWKAASRRMKERGTRYMVTEREYDFNRLIADGRRMFPGRTYQAVCFGIPTPAADLEKTNRCCARARNHRGMFPLLVAGRGTHSPDELRRLFREEGFFGYKVFLNWHGDQYGTIGVDDMIGKEEMGLADELRLIVLFHVPGGRRLADPAVQKGVVNLARRHPGAQIVLAHCGRCYLPDEMKRAIRSIRREKNIFLDTSMVMEPDVLGIVLDQVDSRRVLFATDFPVAAMRGRRVYVMDHWVDVVLEGYSASAYRIASNGIRATFMAWEIALAIKRAGEMRGLPQRRIQEIFHENGMRLLRRVMCRKPSAL